MTESELQLMLRQNKTVWRVLELAGEFGLNQWFVGAGSVCQTVWNIKHGFAPCENLKDIDLVYFDSDDLSSEAEQRAQELVEKRLPNLSLPIEVVNQARVHLWYHEEFGFDISPFQSSADAINNWQTTSTAIGVRLNRHGGMVVHAPFGLDDIGDMIVRPNKSLITKESYESKAFRWKRTWPKLKIIDW